MTSMKLLEGIEENFRFMVLEVTTQVENTFKLLENFNQKHIEKIESRDDYIDNLKSVIENICFARIHGTYSADKRSVDFIRGVNIVSSNLERLADHAVNIVMQTQYFKDATFIKRYDFRSFFAEILKALGLVQRALFNRDLTLAFRICRSEFNLDNLFKTIFDRLLLDFKSGSYDPGELITTLNIFRYLERMGDALLNVGEAIIFSAVGEKFKIHQYEALKDTLEEKGEGMPISAGEFQSIWGTRSGCRIGRVSGRGRDSNGALFKEGNSAKLSQEKYNIERWEEVMPGLPPKIFNFQTDGDSASMLVEYLGGCTFQEIVLSGQPDILQNSMFLLKQTLSMLWDKTMRVEESRAGYIKQLRSRLEYVYRLHPQFRTPKINLCGLKVSAFEDTLAKLERIEEELPAPLTIFIHGDFNSNNILIDHGGQRIHFIDLHRSRQTDYVQDVSVFLTSHFRLPILEVSRRCRINWVIRQFLAFARRFAGNHQDETFEARLALGLIRSLITSARFEFNAHFAGDMRLRALYLADGLIAHADQGQAWPLYKLPDAALAY